MTTAFAHWTKVVCLGAAVAGCGGKISFEHSAAGGALGAGGAGGTGGTATSVDGVPSVTGGTATTLGGSTSALACSGLPTTEQDPAAIAAACNGVAAELTPQPRDLILLIDRSIANSYAVGAETATPATPDQVSRWALLTSAVEAFVATERSIGSVAATLFGRTGEGSVELNCNAADYAKPDVGFGSLADSGPAIVAAMKSIAPTGLSPMVPALVGTYQYATAERQMDRTRQKSVVLISDSFPTQCSLMSPSDVVNVIGEAATAPISIQTFIIGFTSPMTPASAKFNLQNYARAVNIAAPYQIDESAGVATAKAQLVAALLEIATSPYCAYQLAPPSDGRLIDSTRITLFLQPTTDKTQQIPGGGSGMASCGWSQYGGWVPDDPFNPETLTLCPCTCRAAATGRLSVVHGCTSVFIDDDP